MFNIKYEQNYFNKDSSDKTYYVKGYTSRNNSMDDMIKLIHNKHPSVSEEMAHLVLELYEQVGTDCLYNGEAIATPWGRIEPVISGKVKDTEQRFILKQEQYKVSLSLYPLRSFIKSLKSNLKCYHDKHGGRKHFPAIDQIFNINEKEEYHFKKGEIVIIHGNFLKFDKTNPEQGIFFQNKDNKNLLIRINNYIDIYPKKIRFPIPPEIQPGDYNLLLFACPDRTVLQAKSQPLICVDN